MHIWKIYCTKYLKTHFNYEYVLGGGKTLVMGDIYTQKMKTHLNNMLINLEEIQKNMRWKNTQNKTSVHTCMKKRKKKIKNLAHCEMRPVL